jgi:hypothetical protein
LSPVSKALMTRRIAVRTRERIVTL